MINIHLKGMDVFFPFSTHFFQNSKFPTIIVSWLFHRIRSLFISKRQEGQTFFLFRNYFLMNARGDLLRWAVYLEHSRTLVILQRNEYLKVGKCQRDSWANLNANLPFTVRFIRVVQRKTWTCDFTSPINGQIPSTLNWRLKEKLQL